MTRRVHPVRALVAILGTVVLLFTTALAIGSIRLTEATWSDQAVGAAEFGAANPNQNKRFARALSAFGVMERAVRNSDVGAVTAFRQTPDASRQVAGPTTHDSSGSFPTYLLPLTTVGYSCSTLDAQSRCDNGNPTGVATPTATAVSETRSLEVRTSRILGSDLVSYPGRSPIRATAACSPSDGAASLSSDGPVVLGRNGLFEQEVRVPIPGPNSEQTGNRSWGSYDYVATLQHVKKESPGYALSQLRLRINATGTGGAERWNLTLILAHAECGVDRETTAAPTRPTSGEWPILSAQSNRMMAAQADAPTTLQPEDAAPEGVAPEGGEAPDDVPVSDESSASAPTSIDDAREDDAEKGEPRDTAESSTSTPGTTTPVERTESAEKTTEKTAVAEEPQRPANVAPGRWFTVVGRDGVELGSAKIDDIVRTPGCGVALTLRITTSAETGPDRWSSVGPGDFAELRPSGSTRDARTARSDCEQSAASTTTRLSPDREYEIVLAFQLDDAAQRAMLRPEGTAGWAFDLPPLTKVAVVATTVAPVPAAGQPPAETTPAANAPVTVTQTVESDA
ncbi:hypothetical protein [Dietzia psychralcaliphila]|uniref:hypothetical protein n=1 Tax=Dietzia psychralcaliphila TaxID=139021 RepID=UPI001C1E3384|nr:hypothetical protein [Dietzia psychralcaliphila]